MDGSRVQTDRRAQGQLSEIRAGEIDRADVGIEPLRHQVGDVGKRLLQIVRTRNDLGNVRQK